MYLRRFGRQPTSGRRKPTILARDVERLDHPFPTSIRNVAAVTDFYGERVEKLLCQIEGDAVPAFDAMLDDPDGALPGPDRWPLGNVHREAMAWWIAAQIVRTVRQRRRL
ncbi:DUF4238 domain-containing protein [Pseudonocardia broussonetiae]|uniref:DUF4238 domain-containing protein n=2 Tax=Pseudonocardia broussonetiae TaxID=2736640 RepID=A0A6M6JC58_9PSEU|nr:DUF4238 domain-containing protein [Pseudonocardia broussonetiae]